MSLYRLSSEAAPWGHLHRYPRRGEQVNGAVWRWCSNCRCYVIGECDHRRSICRRRVNYLRKKRAKRALRRS